MKSNRVFQWLLRLVFGGILVIVLVTNNASASPLYTKSNNQVALSTPNPNYLVLSGDQWLNGHGVDVYYSQSQSEHVQGQYGTLYECVELVQRLYSTLGYPAIWPVSSAYQIWDMQNNGQQGFEDLEYHPNNGQTPPRPGDIVVWPGSFNQGTGHVAIVNKVEGHSVEIVQQNISYDGQNHPTDSLQLSWDNLGNYTLTASWTSPYAPVGWIHSPRMDGRLALQTSIVNVSNTNGQISWNQDSGTVYIYLSSREISLIKSSHISDNEIVTDILNDNSNILGYTTDAYARCDTKFVVDKIKNDDRFNPDRFVTGITYTIKYTGENIWIRPWGGSANGQWISFTLSC